MAKLTVGEINHYKGRSVNPLTTPDTIYELYSVPSFDEQQPEIIKGADIGSSKNTVEDGDVLICKINPRINRVWVVKHHTDYPLLASSEWIVVRNPEIDSNYLKWYFSSPNFRSLLMSQVAGIGGSLTRAQPKQVAKYPVPIVPIEEQRRIAAVLDKVTDLIAQRRAQLDKLDLLVKSRFVEMFGEENKYTTAEKACNTIVDCPHSTPRYTGQDKIYPAIRTSEIKNGQIDWTTMLYVDIEEYESRTKRLKPMPGDIVYAREGTYGDCVILPEHHKFCLGQRTMLFRPDYSICTSEYLHQALRSNAVKRQADESNAGSTVPHVNVADAKKFTFPLPSLAKQKTFSATMQKTNQVKNHINRSMEELEVLKKSLMQQYFE